MMTLNRKRYSIGRSILSILVLLTWGLVIGWIAHSRGACAMTIYDVDVNRRVDWTQSGYPGEIPDVIERIVDVRKKGAVGNGVADDHGVIQKEIDNASPPAVIFLPKGIYRLNSALKLKSGIVLRGAGSDNTRLEFHSGAEGLNISGVSRRNYVSIQNSLQKSSRKIVVADASAFEAGQGGEIRQKDSNASNSTDKGSDPLRAMGQMVKIVAIDGNTLTIEPSLNIAFPDAHPPEIRPVEYIRQVGVEDLHIRRLKPGNGSANIHVLLAADCWFRRIESDLAGKYHFNLDRSLHLEIRECYIHDAYSKGDDRGYGISLGAYVTAALVENNIFSDLRHAMIVWQGANGCILGYNYAQRNYDDDGRDKSYISLHGSYPYMNLLEGNIVGFAALAENGGACGPGNTLFRNRLIGTDRSREFGPYRGILVDHQSHHQNIIGNELIGRQTSITFDGHAEQFEGTSEDVLVHGNNVHGTITWDSAFDDSILPESLYLSAKPDFFNDLPWPSIGPDQDLGQGTIPALARFTAGQPVPQPTSEPSAGRSSAREAEEKTIPVQENDAGNDSNTPEKRRICFIDTVKK